MGKDPRTRLRGYVLPLLVNADVGAMTHILRLFSFLEAAHMVLTAKRVSYKCERSSLSLKIIEAFFRMLGDPH